MPNCYNKGCSSGGTFQEGDNGPSACTFHPGAPFFHDAYKGWSCCNKKSVDFTDFMNMKGCSTGYHNPIKPAVEVKPVAEPKPTSDIKLPSLNGIDFSNPNPANKPKRMDRPDASIKMIDLKRKLAPSLNQKKVQATESETELIDRECSNGGCKVKHCDKETNPVCLHHPGQAIFHEGLKFWSCCNKKTMEFEEFLKQKGCTKGEHCWFPKKIVTCRFDWHQTATHVTITIYSKGYDPNLVKIQANSVKLLVDLVLPDGQFTQEWILAGIIDENESIASLQSTKVEINLRKAEPMQWAQLDIPNDSFESNSGGNISTDTTVAVDALSLDDL